MVIIVLIATMLALFWGTVFLWPDISSTTSGPAFLRNTDVQSGENSNVAPLSQATNPELRIQERFQADRVVAGSGASVLHDNPELKTLDYAETAAVVDLYANPELKALDYPDQSAP